MKKVNVQIIEDIIGGHPCDSAFISAGGAFALSMLIGTVTAGVGSILASAWYIGCEIRNRNY